MVAILPLVVALAAASSTSAAAVQERASKVPKGFVQASGTKLVLDGKPFYFAGTNAYWFSFISNLTDVSVSMDKAKAAGLKVIRTWAFNEKNVTYVPNGLPQYGSEGAGPSDIVYQWWANGKPTINTGPNGLGRLDQVVQLAEKKGLKLIMTLTNNWADYGGMDVYAVNLGETYHDSFYTSPKVISAFKAYVKAVVNRYKNSPAVFAWELANEPRCAADGVRNIPRSQNCTTETITKWADDLSTYVKSLDPYHLVALGDEGAYNVAGSTDGFYSGSDGIDFEANLQLKNLDIGTFHAYPDWWSKTVEWTTQWVEDHAHSQKKYKKPVILEEYGWLLNEDRIAWLGRSSNVTRTEALSSWQKASINHKLAGDMFWQLGISNLSFGKSTDDGFTIYLEDAEAKTLVYDHVKKVEALNK